MRTNAFNLIGLTNFSLGSILDDSLQLTQEKLEQFSISAEFESKIWLAFGDSWNLGAATVLIQELATQNSSLSPKFEPISDPLPI